MTEKEDSVVLKILRDPTSPKFVCAIFSLLQLQIFWNNSNKGLSEELGFTILVAVLTFLASCLTIGLIAGKKTEGFANFCLFKCVTQKKRIDWNGFYYAYATAFGSFNLLTIIGKIWKGDVLAAIFGLIVTILYYVDGYYAYEKIDTINFNESSSPGYYARFLKLIGSFPKILRLLVLTLNVALIVLLVNRIGCQHYYSNINDYYYNQNYYRTQNYYDCGRSDDLYMISIIAAMSIIFSILDGFILRVKKFKVGIAKHLMLTITTMSFSMCGFFVCLNKLRIPATIITLVIFLLMLFMTIAESYVKSNEPIMETNNRTILPSNLAKNIINPVVPDALKIQINQEVDPSKLTNDIRPLLQ
uniref:Uncharacterized protein n=1 Tax=Acrobeloides nanus TaxID=290746 RepID=A0A914C7H6_9BILA